MAEKKAKRERGRILTESGWNALDTALQAWEILPGNKRTFERIGFEAQLDPGTVAKIFKRREGSDLSKLDQLFRAFQLTLQSSDHSAAAHPTPQADPNFVGREGAIADLTALINRNANVIVIQARGGVGKTTLARKYLQQELDSVLEFPIAKETKDIASIESLIEEKLRQLGEEPGREFLVSIDRLKRKLQRDRIGILIDNLEPALDSAGKFIEPHRRYVELLRVLADPSVQSVTLITSRERLNEYSVSVQHYLLGELSLDAWTQFFQNRFAFAEPKPFSDEDQTALAALHDAYGGNAKAMDILCGAVLTDYSGNIAAYWHTNQNDLLIERALEDLVVSQFDRLQQLDPDAYNLLCRMGCYRYQDVPTVPLEGLLCLLWDVPENRQRRVVKVLRERSLVEFQDGEYLLHPVIRAEAIRQVNEGEDWKITNHKIAEFWTENVKSVETVKDALRALEAYFHYLEIDDFEQAGNVLLKDRKNTWVEKLISEELGTESKHSSLGASLCRLGLFKQAITAISQIIDKIEPGIALCSLYHRMAALLLPIGHIRESIAYSEKAIEIASRFDIERIKIGASLHIGYCKIDLLELDDAFKIFNEIKLLSHKVSYPQSIPVRVRLAFLYSCLDQKDKSIELIEEICEEIPNIYVGIRGKAYVLLFLGLTYKNLSEFRKAIEFHQEAILYSQKIHFYSVKAQALSSLSDVFRGQKNIEKAFKCNLESIEILESIGAKCSLAEAYYKIGLTYKDMSETEKSDESFQMAVQLFTEIEAPKQVERVRRSMAGSELAPYKGVIQSTVDPLEYQREIRDEWS